MRQNDCIHALDSGIFQDLSTFIERGTGRTYVIDQNDMPRKRTIVHHGERVSHRVQSLVSMSACLAAGISAPRKQSAHRNIERSSDFACQHVRLIEPSAQVSKGMEWYGADHGIGSQTHECMRQQRGRERAAHRSVASVLHVPYGITQARRRSKRSGCRDRIEVSHPSPSQCRHVFMYRMGRIDCDNPLFESFTVVRTGGEQQSQKRRQHDCTVDETAPYRKEKRQWQLPSPACFEFASTLERSVRERNKILRHCLLKRTEIASVLPALIRRCARRFHIKGD